MNIKDLMLSQTCQIQCLPQLYEKYLPDRGFFVEVGAFDGESFSNTSGLADLGWTGLYIEPHPVYAAKCRARHALNDVRIVENAVASEPKTIVLQSGGALTTASEATKEAYSRIDWAKGIRFDGQIPVVGLPLESILREANVGRQFDLLVVDVEGFEYEVFVSFNLPWWSPAMVIVELNDYHKSFDDMPKLQLASKQVREMILASGYMQVYADAINSVFVSNKLKGIR